MLKTMIKPVFPCLWFDGKAHEAADYYCSLFPGSKILESNPIVVTFEVFGSKFMALNGGDQFTFNESVSFVIECETQQEIDYYWDALVAGGEESMCGWLKDRFGVSWQVVPSKMGQWMSDPARSERIMQVAIHMRKLDLEKLENA
jgi:predicted 3-demethylubiquinone-9 3-methyltransferase (glyoxalase superfamily)